MIGPNLVEFGPVEIGPFTLDHVPWTGVLAASGFLGALALSLRQARRAGLRPALVLELFAVAAPVALLASRFPALARAFPAFLHDARGAADALASRGSLPWGLLAVAILAFGFAWASRQPARFLDAAAPGALVLAAATVLTRRLDPAGMLVAATALALAVPCAALAGRLRPGALAALAGAGSCGVLIALPLLPSPPAA